jgi:hypothetical protein
MTRAMANSAFWFGKEIGAKPLRFLHHADLAEILLAQCREYHIEQLFYLTKPLEVK